MLRVSADMMRLPSPPAHGAGSASYRRGERGQTLLEMAVCLLVLLTLLFGIMQAGFAAYSYHFIADAAREGARWAIVRGSACTGFGSACPASATDIQNYVKGLGFPGIDTTKMTVNVYCGPNASTPATPAGTCTAGNDDPGDLVLVQIVYQFPLALPLVPLNTINMHAQSQMTISQ